MPMYIDRITSIDKVYPQFDAEGYAISLPGMPIVKRPKDLPMDLLLFTFNESGTIYTVSKDAKDKKRFAVLANNVIMALIYGYTIRKAAGPDAEIYCILDRNTPVSLKAPGIEELKKKVFTEILYVNMMRPVDCLKKFADKPQVDMVVNCADIPGAETLSVMATRSGGTVIFANFISNYNIALYVTEATSKDLNIKCADGYLDSTMNLTSRSSGSWRLILKAIWCQGRKTVAADRNQRSTGRSWISTTSTIWRKRRTSSL